MTTTNPLAKLVVLHDGENRDEWLQARVPLITATKAAAIAGSHPYTKLIDVWNERTDPNYDGEYLRNRWLEERAELGVAREPEIIAWVNESKEAGSPDHPFVPNSMLVATKAAAALGHASTPDGARKVGRKLGLVECKATQQRWDQTGVPQHILDQCYWQMYTTGAVVVWLGVEFYEWVGKGNDKTPVKVGQMLKQITMDENRLTFLLAQVERFEEWVREDIAPESDVFLSTEPAYEFTDTPEEIAQKQAQAAEAQRLDALLTELDNIELSIAEAVKRMAAIKAAVKKVAEQYEGRRIHLIGERRIAKLTRFFSTKHDVSKLPEETLREITSWSESSRLVVDPNPEYVAPEGDAEPVGK